MRHHRDLRVRRILDPLALDDGTADRILNGVDDADVPPAYAGVARSLTTMRVPGRPEELRSEKTVVAAFAEAVAPPVEQTRRRLRIPKISQTTGPKLAAAAAAGGLALGGGLAAAATGSLPGPAQRIASQALAGIGIHVPGSNSHARGHPQLTGDSGANAGDSPTGSKSGEPGSAIAGVVPTVPAGGIGNSTCSTASAGNCQPGQNRAGASSQAPFGTPNQGGTATANTASKGASLGGTTTATKASGGASGAGSGNATTHVGSSTAPTPIRGPNTAGPGNASLPGSTTGTNASGGAGSGNVIVHPGVSPANSSNGSPANAAQRAP